MVYYQFRRKRQSGGGGESPSWTFFDLTQAEGSSDTSSLVDSGPTYNNTTKVNSVDINMNATGAAVLDTDDTAYWWWDTGLTAADDFGLQFELQFTDIPSMTSNDIAIWFGLTSDPNDMNNYSFGAGGNFQTGHIRGYRVVGTTRSVGSIGLNREGVKITLTRAGSTQANSGNIAFNAIMQGLDETSGNWEGGNTFYSVSNLHKTASSTSDSLYFFLAIGVIVASDNIETVDFRLKVSPLITNKTDE